MESQVCRAVLETNVAGLVEYDWMSLRVQAESLLNFILAMVRPKENIVLLQSYIECAQSFII